MIRLVKAQGAKFDAVKWVISALDLKDKGNPTYRHVFILNSKMYGTNGHRQHVALLTADFPTAHGAYSITVNTAKEIILLPAPDIYAPEFDRVIPKVGDIEPVDVEPTAIHYAAVIRAMPAPWAVNYDYFKDAAACTDTCTVCMSHNTPILRFDATNGNIAVVTPLRG